MATRPGVTITTSAATAAATPGQRLGNYFLAAITQRGPLLPDQASPCRNLGDYVALYGGRDATIGAAVAFDAVDAYFRSGGSNLYVARVVGPAAVAASLTIQDRNGTPANTIKVSAKGPGAWANTHLKVAVADGALTGTFYIQVLVDNVAVEQSPDLTTPTDAVTWSARSSYVTISDLASASTAPANNPKVTASTSLAAGADDLSSVTDVHWTAALNTAFPAIYGPGLVSKVGVTTAAGHAGTIAHAYATNRMALLDAPQGATQATLTTLAQTVQGAATAPEYGMVLAPWLTIPPASGGTANRYVPPSSVAAGLISAQVTSGTAAKAAAGANGQARWVLDTAPAVSGGVGQTFTDAERDLLAGSAAVNLFRRAYSASAVPPVELYGYDTLGGLSNGWRQVTAQLLRLQIVDELQLIAEQFIFGVLDGRGHTISQFGGAIAGALHAHWENDELYGTTPAEAYTVDVGPAVNTPTTLAAGYLNARVNIRVSPMAEFLTIDIVKVPVNQSL